MSAPYYDPHCDGGHSKSMAEHYDRLEEEKQRDYQSDREQRAKKLEDNLEMGRAFAKSLFERRQDSLEVPTRLEINRLKGGW